MNGDNFSPSSPNPFSHQGRRGIIQADFFIAPLSRAKKANHSLSSPLFVGGLGEGLGVRGLA